MFHSQIRGHDVSGSGCRPDSTNKLSRQELLTRSLSFRLADNSSTVKSISRITPMILFVLQAGQVPASERSLGEKCLLHQ